MTNPFDQFDAPVASSANPFDQFDAAPAQHKHTYAQDVEALAANPAKVAWDDVKAIPGDIVSGFKSLGERALHDLSNPKDGVSDLGAIARKLNPISSLIDTAKGAVQDPEGTARAVADPAKPVSSLLNALTMGTGGGATVGRAALRTGTGIAGGADRVAQVPVAMLSGVSPDAQMLASRAGELGGRESKAFTGQMRGSAPPEAPVHTAQSAAQKMRQRDSDAYLADKANWNEADKYLDVAPVARAVEDANKTVNFGGLPYNDKAARAVDAVEEAVNGRRLQSQPGNAPLPQPGVPVPVAGQSMPSLTSSPRLTVRTPASTQTIPGTSTTIKAVTPSSEALLSALTRGGPTKGKGLRAGPEGPAQVSQEGATMRTPAQQVTTPGTSVTYPATGPTPQAALSSWVNQPTPTPHGPRMTGPVGNGVMGPVPNPHLSIEGMDKMKQAIGEIMYDKNLAPEGTLARKVTGEVYNSIKDAISTQAPNYAKAMERASGAIQQLNEIKGTLSLGEKARIDTALSKLQSVLRNDVSSRFGFRKKALLDELAKFEPTLPYELAGQTMSTYMPRGLSKLVATGNAVAHGAAGIGALLHPGVIAPLLASSPRLIGEARHAAGSTVRGARAVGATQANMGRLLEALRLHQQSQEQK